jgi:glutathione S-transferase
VLELFHGDGVVESVQKRHAALKGWLGGRDCLEDRFTALDLLMTTVLRILRHTDIVSAVSRLKAYQERCEVLQYCGPVLAFLQEPQRAAVGWRNHGDRRSIYALHALPRAVSFKVILE